MAKQIRKAATPQDKMTEVIDEVKASPEVVTQEVPINEMPLITFRDYRLYNERARSENKRLKLNRYPIEQAPVELHPTQRVRISRKDGQASNVIPVHLSNHLIHYEKKLIPGKIYDIPVCVLHFLEKRGHPVWNWFEGKNGARETGIDHYDPRFAISNVYSEE